MERTDGAPAPEYVPGSQESFEQLYRATYQRVFGTILAMLRDRAAAEDCAQEVYVKAYKAWPRWKADAPIEAWLHRIAVNTVISWRRREKLREIGEVLKRLGRPREEDPIDSVMESVLLRELKELPPEQAATIVLRHLHGYTNRDIAYALNVPERTIASRLAAAKGKLRRRLEELEIPYFPSTRPGLRVSTDD